ncbi:DUF3300 domain-containing protein [Mesorhizobium sp.]|uniref:DUF3300 domain-containing protein n=1 Tax=Mesorhizobium sp. TaxID=1871066 RepID=UPI001217B1F8|nr:DUF3300 domain-containing protein [Mesorhizobium sp.]TIO04502.1 MAG: DUF3300 domain-containing protein [Mesorhizobium sp.]TIO29310.1 MAG: DUF3300 domain-containing protein [Mesorhizobium sp.]TIP10015.1 MAG: DUF3300 domain-containing protein [Mesorhizobium sp.]
MGNGMLKAGAAALALLLAGLGSAHPVLAQEQVAAAGASGAATTSPEPLNADEMEILVARIALYPDELIAVITAAALYPLQIVDAARFLDRYEKDKSLKPKESWDGSVVSLLNYPEVVKMMSDDLEWTQALGDAIAYQQKDVLIAIQQLRDEAVAKGVIKTDDKIQVVEENDNVVIKSASPEVIYVPQYPPQMLYEPDYVWEPIRYYPDPYPYYWYPGATFFAGAVTGAIWAAAVDWDDWGVWGGRWNGGDIDIDCNNCFNNRDFNGKVNFNDVDWKNVDRSKINIDRNQLNKFDRNEIKNKVKANGDNAIRDRAKDIKKRDQVANRGPGKTAGTRDIRKSTLDGLKGQGGQATNRPANKANVNRPAAKPTANRPAAKPANVNRKAGKPKPATRVDNRPKKPSGLGNVNRGKSTKVSSNRGHKSMGGGSRGGGAHKQIRRPSGGGRRR